MNISSSLIAKGAAGTLATTTAIGGGGVVANKLGLFDGFSGINAEPAEEKAAGSEDLRVDPDATRDNAPKGPEASGQQVDGSSQGTETSGDTASPKIESGSLPGGSKPTGDQVGNALDTTVTTDSESSPETGQRQPQNSNGVDGGGRAREATTQTTKKSTQDKESAKWDKALIDYLGKQNNGDWDIIFAVKTGKEANSALTDAFPAFEDEDGEENKQKSVATFTVTASNTSLNGTGSNAEIEKLKKTVGGKDGNQDWTWECKVMFSKDKEDGDNLPFENKDELVGSNGFFNKLTRSGEKELKIKFIKNCGTARDGGKTDKQKGKTSPGNTKITSEKTFELKKEGNAKWKVKKGGVDGWFSEKDKSEQSQVQA